MLAHNKVAGINHLIVLTIIVAMLGTTQFAMAAPHRPWRLPPGCPPECSDPPYDETWKFTMGTHVGVANTAYQYVYVSKDELLTTAKRMNNFATEIIDNGTYKGAETVVLNVLASGKWDSISLSAWQNFLVENKFSNVLPQAVMQAMLDDIPSSMRASIAWNIQTYGLWASMYEAAAILTQFANMEDAREHGRTLPPMTIPNTWARVIFRTLEFTGGIICATGDPIGLVFVAGGFAGNVYMDANGMSKVVPSVEELQSAYRREHPWIREP
jgi:hypothetical protein